MKEELKDLAVSGGLVGIGVYARAKLGGKPYTWQQIVALIGVGIAIILILNKTNFGEVTKMTACLIYGLISPNIIGAIIKGATKGEDKAAKNIEDKIDNLTK